MTCNSRLHASQREGFGHLLNLVRYCEHSHTAVPVLANTAIQQCRYFLCRYSTPLNLERNHGPTAAAFGCGTLNFAAAVQLNYSLYFQVLFLYSMYCIQYHARYNVARSTSTTFKFRSAKFSTLKYNLVQL